LNALDYKPNRTLTIGSTGAGKSTHAARYIKLHPAKYKFVYDWQGGEFAHRLNQLLLKNPDEIKDAIEKRSPVICIDGETMFDNPESDGFDWFCETILETCDELPGQKLIVVDELQECISPNKMPLAFARMLRLGRRKMADTLCIGTAANALHNVGRNLVTDFNCFRCTDDTALAYPTSLGLDKEEIRALDDGEFINLNLRTGEQKKLALWEKKSTP
jgi:hypothetical protein